MTSPIGDIDPNSTATRWGCVQVGRGRAQRVILATSMPSSPIRPMSPWVGPVCRAPSRPQGACRLDPTPAIWQLRLWLRSTVPIRRTSPSSSLPPLTDRLSQRGFGSSGIRARQIPALPPCAMHTACLLARATPRRVRTRASVRRATFTTDC